METQEHIHRNDNPDSVEIGAPSKQGAIKVYGSADDPEGFKKKIKSMMDVRKFAQIESEGV